MTVLELKILQYSVYDIGSGMGRFCCFNMVVEISSHYWSVALNEANHVVIPSWGTIVYKSFKGFLPVWRASSDIA